MARATRNNTNNKAAAAVSSPPAGRTRARLKEKESAAVPSSSSSQPAENTVAITNTAPVTRAAATKKTPAPPKKAPTTKKANNTKKAPARTAKASNKNNTASEDSSDNATKQPVNKRTKRQPAVDRNAKNKVTKPNARKAPSKVTSTSKKAIQQHVEQEVAATPARAARGRHTRGASKAGTASPLAPVIQNVDAIIRKPKLKKSLKNATPLSIMTSQEEHDEDDSREENWFPNLEQHPRIYRDAGASMEEISTREEADDDVVDLDTATSDDGEDAMVEDDAMVDDVDMAADHAENDDADMVAEPTENDPAEMAIEHAENDGSETEADTTDDEQKEDEGNDDEHQDPQTPAQASQVMEAPTTAHTFGIRRLFFNPLASVVKPLASLAIVASPILQSPLSPAIASPSSAAQERRNLNNARASNGRSSSSRVSTSTADSPFTRNRNKPITPREKNADRRHSESEIQQSIAELEEEELLSVKRTIADIVRKRKGGEAAQAPGQKRRRLSPAIIPARLPGAPSGSYGQVDLYFNNDDEEPVDTPVENAPKRRKIAAESEDDDTDSEYDFAAPNWENHTPPSSLKRPRNSARMAAIREGFEDPMVINHETRVMHQENSFSRSPLRDSPNMANKKSPKTNKPSSSTIYSGSLMAMPGDAGYKPENVFKKSEHQILFAEELAKMSKEELKKRAEEIVAKQKSGIYTTPEEDQLVDKAQRKFGHIAGSGSFSSPEYDSDDEDSILSDDPEEATSPERAAPQGTSPTEPAKPASESTNIQPPPAPTPAHAQLPANNVPLTESAVSKTPSHNQNTSSFQNAALARQRELAEKHKPKMGSRLQYVSEISSSPVSAKSPDGNKSSMSESLITQGIENDVFAAYDALVEAESFEFMLTSEEMFMVENESPEEKKAREVKAFALFDSMVARGF
ncbi:hypothetical protein B0J12DRAFT_738715 [Macrophomina phaseolina]|uniref:Uncharacterized protein n=1 Tax=Macrophomina phaseolina TaxID=35725 RepID=A0ABQ8GHU1_9PEZI|nr:hypothetical protein B0J12DRAFT_738715 [Macrophomina phaseolina]